jgi:hypothetical protein
MSSSLRDILHFAVASSAFFLYGYLEVSHQQGYWTAIILASYFILTGKASRLLSWLMIAFHMISRFVWESPAMALLSFLVLDVMFLFQTTPKPIPTHHAHHHKAASPSKAKSPAKKDITDNTRQSEQHVSPKQKIQSTGTAAFSGIDDNSFQHHRPSLEQPSFIGQSSPQYGSSPPTPPSTPYQEFFPASGRTGSAFSGLKSFPASKPMSSEFVTIPLDSLSKEPDNENNISAQFPMEGHGETGDSTPKVPTPKAKKRHDREIIKRALEQAREEEFHREQQLLQRLQQQQARA